MTCNKLFLILPAVLLLAGFSSCIEKQAAADGKLHLLSTFYPITALTENITIGVNNIELTTLASEQTGCLHDYQLTANDMKRIEKADVLIENGAGMEKFTQKALSARKDLKIIEASRGLNLIMNGNDPNPHVWVSVTGAMEEVSNIAAQLSVIDPENAAAYQTNAAVYLKKLEALKKEMHRVIDPLPNREVITFHEAFPYFAKEFNLKVAAVVEREPGSEPSAAELADTIKMIRNNKMKAVFAEPQYSDAAARTIALETGAAVYFLDPFVTGEKKIPLNAYEEVMKKNLAVLEQALK